MKCPICEREFLLECANSLPFCSPRCKEIDRARWLGEKYGLQIESENSELDGEAVVYEEEE